VVKIVFGRADSRYRDHSDRAGIGTLFSGPRGLSQEEGLGVRLVLEALEDVDSEEPEESMWDAQTNALNVVPLLASLVGIGPTMPRRLLRREVYFLSTSGREVLTVSSVVRTNQPGCCRRSAYQSTSSCDFRSCCLSSTRFFTSGHSSPDR